jgi:hypothetical protein
VIIKIIVCGSAPSCKNYTVKLNWLYNIYPYISKTNLISRIRQMLTISGNSYSKGVFFTDSVLELTDKCCNSQYLLIFIHFKILIKRYICLC